MTGAATKYSTREEEDEDDVSHKAGAQFQFYRPIQDRPEPDCLDPSASIVHPPSAADPAGAGTASCPEGFEGGRNRSSASASTNFGFVNWGKFAVIHFGPLQDEGGGAPASLTGPAGPLPCLFRIPFPTSFLAFSFLLLFLPSATGPPSPRGWVRLLALTARGVSSHDGLPNSYRCGAVYQAGNARMIKLYSMAAYRLSPPNARSGPISSCPCLEVRQRRRIL